MLDQQKMTRALGEALTRLCLPVCLSGVLVAGAFGNFCTEATGFSRQFPGLKSHLLMLPFWFRVPIFRDYIMCGGRRLSAPGSSWFVSDCSDPSDLGQIQRCIQRGGGSKLVADWLLLVIT